MQPGLDAAERVFVDDRRNLDFDPLRLWTRLACSAVVAIELVSTDIGRIDQKIVKAAGPEPAAPSGDAALVEMAHDGLQAFRWPFSTEIKVEDLAYLARLGLVDDQNLLVLVATALLDDGAIAKWRDRAVPEALSGVFQHGAVGVLGILVRLVLVEGVDDLADQVAMAILAEFLGDRDELHAGTLELADVELGVHRVAAEAAQRVDDDIVKRSIRPRRLGDHVLEYRAILIERRGARFGEHLGDDPALAFAIGFQLLDLVGQRQVSLSLSHRRDTGVDGNAFGLWGRRH